MENSIKHLLFDSLPFEAFSKTAPMKLPAGLQNAASSFQGQRKRHVTQRRNKSRSKRSFGFIAGFTSHANRRGNDLSEAGWLMMVTGQRRPDTHRYTQQQSHVHGLRSINHTQDMYDQDRSVRKSNKQNKYLKKTNP